jgi:uracil-DNA glycosylase family 4
MQTNDYLQAMGIQAWQLKKNPSSTDTLRDAALRAAPQGERRDDWDTLRAQAAACTACTLHETRTHVVFGVGNPNADVMVIGEAPGFYEDQQGEPFVGRAGQLLNAMLEAIDLNREKVYIANILKCRPPNNRDPLPEEVELCTHFLEKQIALVQPKILLAVGRIAAHFLLKTKTSLSQLRGKFHSYQNIPLMVTFHPAYLLRTPGDKGKAYQDLLLLKGQITNGCVPHS